MDARCGEWGQNKNGSTNEISALQDRALRVISFKNRNTTAGPSYKEKKVIKFFNLIMFYNCLFVAKDLHQNLPSSLLGVVLLTWLTTIIMIPGAQ